MDDNWASTQLTEDGEDVLGTVRQPQYLLLARTILLAPLPLGSTLQSEPASRDASAAAASVCEPPDAVSADEKAEQRVHDSMQACSSLPWSWSWWAARTLTAQQGMLNARSATLRLQLRTLYAVVLRTLGDHAPQDDTFSAAAHLEAALMEVDYGYHDIAEQHLRESGQSLGFSVELTGQYCA